MTERPPIAIAIPADPTPSLPLDRLRMRFFPRGPGPGLGTFVLILGVYPSMLATVLFMGAGIDGGFYKHELFIRGQHTLLVSLASIFSFGALACLGFVLQAIWADRRSRGSRALLALALVATIGWDWLAVGFVRPQLMPVITRSEVEAYAAQPVEPKDVGLQEVHYNNRVMRYDIAIPEGITREDSPARRMGPIICTRLGRLFAGPVDILDLRFFNSDGVQFAHRVARNDCRRWYLQNRAPIRRPQPLTPPGEVPFALLWQAG